MFKKEYICLSMLVLLGLVVLGCGENLPKGDPVDFRGKIFLTEKKSCIAMDGKSIEASSEIKFTEDGEMCLHEACSDQVDCIIDPVIDGTTILLGPIVYYLSEDGKKIMDPKGEIYYLF